MAETIKIYTKYVTECEVEVTLYDDELVSYAIDTCYIKDGENLSDMDDEDMECILGEFVEDLSYNMDVAQYYNGGNELCVNSNYDCEVTYEYPNDVSITSWRRIKEV